MADCTHVWEVGPDGSEGCKECPATRVWDTENCVWKIDGVGAPKKKASKKAAKKTEKAEKEKKVGRPKKK